MNTNYAILLATFFLTFLGWFTVPAHGETPRTKPLKEALENIGSVPTTTLRKPRVEPEPVGKVESPKNKSVDLSTYKHEISEQKQFRHLKGANYKGAGYMRSMDDAQKVFSDFRTGRTPVVGKTPGSGNPVVRNNDVIGVNVYNKSESGATLTVEQDTNLFMIKGTSSPSVVPINPNKELI
ncbi:hypothetical protein OAM69_05180 [bacterium]|nr:hypothetical protein [bacterium]